MIQLSAKLGIWIAAALILAACSAGVPGQAPSGADQPIQGQPGQPGPSAAPPGISMVQGQVTDSAGKPISGVLVAAQSTDTPPQPIPEIAVYTDEQGNYQWSLPPGGYSLTFTHQDYAPGNQPVAIQPGQTATLNVTLAK